MKLPRIGLRDEAALVLPLGLVALIGISTFSLFSYRNAIRQWVEEAREEAEEVLRQALSEELAADVAQLRRLAPSARGVALVARDGLPVARVGVLSGENLRSLTPDRPRGAMTLGPDRRTGPVVVALAPVELAGEELVLRIDLPARALSSQLRTLPVLTAVVLGTNGALLVLLLHFSRRRLAPIERVIERARGFRGDGARVPAAAEVDLLVGTLEQALDVLASQGEDDLEVLRRALSPGVGSGLLLLDAGGTILAINEVGQRLLGLEHEQVGESVRSGLATFPELVALLEMAITGGGGAQREECPLEVAGESRRVGLTVHPLFRDSGNLRGHLVLFADLTEVAKRTQQERLSESLTHIAEVAAGVAHELRNSLSSLLGYISLLERRPSGDSAFELIGELRSEAEQLQRVVEDFLSFARPGTARMEPVDLERVVRRAAADPLLEGGRIRIERDGSTPLKLAGDAQLLERALRNLLHNGVAAQREAGSDQEIVVRLSAGSGELVIEIDDHGPGISSEMQQRLFVPFATHKSDGAGLGLALSHRIVHLHGGELELRNREGGGARAILRFELDRSDTDGNHGSAQQPSPGLRAGS